MTEEHRSYNEDRLEDVIEQGQKLAKLALQLVEKTRRGQVLLADEVTKLAEAYGVLSSSAYYLVRHTTPTVPEVLTEAQQKAKDEYVDPYQNVINELVEEWRDAETLDADVLEATETKTVTFKFWEERSESYRGYYEVEIPARMWEDCDFQAATLEAFNDAWGNHNIEPELDCCDGYTDDSGVEVYE